MGLSGLDSNKYKTILRYKRQINERCQCSSQSTQAHKPVKGRREIDEFGEVAVSYLQQPCRIEFTDDEIKQMISDYQEGQSTHKLAEQFNCSKTTISTLLKLHGITVTNRKAQAKLDAAKIIRMYYEQQTIEEIAKIFEVSSDTINKCLRKNGVKIRSRWDYPAK